MNRKSLIVAGVVLGVVFMIAVSNAFWSASTGAIKTQIYDRFCPRVSVVDGGAANASLYAAGLTSHDYIFCSLHFDTVAASLDWVDMTDSTYYVDDDTVACGLSTAAGYVLLFWHDVQP